MIGIFFQTLQIQGGELALERQTTESLKNKIQVLKSMDVNKKRVNIFVFFGQELEGEQMEMKELQLSHRKSVAVSLIYEHFQFDVFNFFCRIAHV